MIPYTYDFDYYVGDTYPIVLYDGGVEEKVVYVGVGGYGTTDGIYGVVSTDLITWTQTTLPNPNIDQNLYFSSLNPGQAGWSKVVGGNGMFWATTSDGNSRSNISARSVDGINWIASTLPVRGTWKSTAFGNGIFVGRTWGASIVSTDLISFQSYTGLAYGGTDDMAYGNGVFVASGYFGFSVSTDGATWTSGGDFGDYRGIEFGNGKFVSVPRNNQRIAKISTDGIAWINGTMPQNSSWTDIAYGNGTFVVTTFTYINTVALSTDGITWTTAAHPSSSNSQIVFGNGVFWTGGHISTNGITWTPTSSPGPLTGLAISNGQFSTSKYIKDKKINFTVATERGNPEAEIFSIPVDVSNPEYRLSFEIDSYRGSLLTGASYVYDIEVNDKQTNYDFFTYGTLPSNALWSSITYGDNKFVAVARSSRAAAISTDGIAWKQTTLPISVPWVSVTYGNGKFIAISGHGGNGVSISTNGEIWTQGTFPISTSWSSITYGNGSFVAVSGIIWGESKISAVSTDGQTWTQGTLPINAYWRSIAYGNDIFVAVSYRPSAIATSTNGIVWTQRSYPIAGRWISVTYGNETFVAVERYGFGTQRAVSSTDGITWTQRTLPYADWSFVTYGNNKFIAISGLYINSVTAASSTDAITWTQRTLPISASWISASYNDNIFVAVSSDSSESVISTDGVLWTYYTGIPVYNVVDEINKEVYTLLTGTITTQQDVKSN